MEGSRTSSLLIKYNSVVYGIKIMMVLMLPIGKLHVVRRSWFELWFYYFPVGWPLMLFNLTTFAYLSIKMIY